MSDINEFSSSEAEEWHTHNVDGHPVVSGAQLDENFDINERREHARKESLATSSRFSRNADGVLEGLSSADGASEYGSDEFDFDSDFEADAFETDGNDDSSSWTSDAEDSRSMTIDSLKTRPSFNDAIDETDVFSVSALNERQSQFDVISSSQPDLFEPAENAQSSYQFQRLSGDGHIITHTSVSDREWRRREERRQKATKRRIIPRWLVMLLSLAVLGGIATFLFLHRPVEFSANDKRLSATNGTTLESIFESQGKPATPGNFVSVAGTLLTEGEGNPFVATVDGTQMDYAEAREYKIHGGEEIVFGTGSDVMEDYDVELIDVQPTLRVEGGMGSIAYVSQWAQTGQMEIRTGKTSGEKAEGDVITPVKDCVVQMRNITPKDGSKLIALTFDDGPSEYTESILRILRDRGAVATFFNYGDNANLFPDACRAIAQSGNQLCNHGMQHMQLVGQDGDTIYNEIINGRNTIRDIAAAESTFLRPPYGEFNEYTWLATRGQVSAVVTWTRDTLDWSQPGSEAIISRALNDIQPGDVILMHDGGGYRGQTVEALPQIIDALRREGYTFVTISDLMRSAGDIPEDICSGTATMPESAVWPTEIAGIQGE
ncbi:MAG: polysaccharide deacetylase family protein [Atopobiaceae bacterium]|nr:polysaccharide deacetylase family protein [Atopobiaceae bacterium]